MQAMDPSGGRQVALSGSSSYQVYACGPFLVKRWDGASHQSVPVGDWGGSHYPRLLFKVLLTSPERQASRGRLLEILWPNIDPEEAGKYLNDAAYRLRVVLRPTKGAESLLLTAKDTSSYALVGQERLWVDADAALVLLEQVDEHERQDGDVLSLLDEAASYLSRGEFLAEEELLLFYGRRARVARARRGCLLAQAKAYGQRGWLRRGEALLSSLLEENALDEDALCVLMLNLQQQGRTSEGLRLYEETKALLEREGLTPTETTRATEQYLRSEPSSLTSGSAQLLHLPSQYFDGVSPVSQNLIGKDDHSSQGAMLSSPSVTYHIYTMAMYASPTFSQAYSPNILSNRQIEKVDGPSLSVLNSRHTLASGIALMKEDRRRLLRQMLTLAGGMVAAPQVFFEMASLERLAESVISPSRINDFTLTQLETVTRSHWHLFLHAPSKTDLLSSFWGHLQTILQFLRHPQQGAIRNRLYSIAGESAQMIGEILFDMQEYQQAQTYYDFSISAAKEAGNNVLRAVGLGRLSFLPIYQDEPLQAYPMLEEAKQLLSSVSRPVISSWLAVVEAETVAHLHDEGACEQALERAINQYHQEGGEEDRLWTRLNAATIPGYQGACYLQLHQPHKALDALRETLACVPDYSPRHRSLILADMAAAMQQMEEIEEACKLLHHALEITTQTKSLMVLTRMQRVRNNLDPWKETSYVKQLDTSISELLPRIIA